MKTVFKTRLLKLAEVLMHFKKETKTCTQNITSFDMHDWKCGTAACAAGTAMFHPWFNARGFKAKQRLAHGYQPLNTYKKANGWDEGWAAVESFFGLSTTDAEYIFTDFNYVVMGDVAPKHVAARIRKFVKYKEKQVASLKRAA